MKEIKKMNELKNLESELKRLEEQLSELKWNARTWRVRLYRLQRGAKLNGMQIPGLENHQKLIDYGN